MHISTYFPKALHYFSFSLAIFGAANEVNENKFTHTQKKTVPKILATYSQGKTESYYSTSSTHAMFIKL